MYFLRNYGYPVNSYWFDKTASPWSLVANPTVLGGGLGLAAGGLVGGLAGGVRAKIRGNSFLGGLGKGSLVGGTVGGILGGFAGEPISAKLLGEGYNVKNYLAEAVGALRKGINKTGTQEYNEDVRLQALSRLQGLGRGLANMWQTPDGKALILGTGGLGLTGLGSVGAFAGGGDKQSALLSAYLYDKRASAVANALNTTRQYLGANPWATGALIGTSAGALGGGFGSRRSGGSFLGGALRGGVTGGALGGALGYGLGRFINPVTGQVIDSVTSGGGNGGGGVGDSVNLLNPFANIKDLPEEAWVNAPWMNRF